MHRNTTTPPRRTPRRSPPLALLLTLTLAATAPAQEPAPSSPPDRPAAPAVHLIAIRFPGGTLADLIAAIRTVAPPSTNVLVPPEAQRVPVPPLELADVEVVTALRMTETFGAPDFDVDHDSIESRRGEPIHVIRVRSRARPPEIQSAVLVTRVFSLSNLLVAPPTELGASAPQSRSPTVPPTETEARAAELQLSAQTVLSAIEAGLELGGRKPDVELAFHQASSLLFCRGAADRVDLVDHTLKALTIDLTERRIAAMRRRASGDARKDGGEAALESIDKLGGIDSPPFRAKQDKDR